MEPHFEATAEVIADASHVFVIHDTSQFSFPGEVKREGLGRLGRGKKENGFYGHFALAVSADGQRTPLGLLGFHSFVLDGPVRVSREDGERKSKRWGALVDEVEDRLSGRASLIHLMDREADDYQLLEQLESGGRRFIMRARCNRTIEADDAFEPLRTVMEEVDSVLEREVPLSSRRRHQSPINRKIHPPRNARWATLHCRAKRIRLLRPCSRAMDCDTAQLEINVVQVHEPAPPPDQPAVEWLLLTSEPIETAEQVAAVVDGYRTRWVIEEYFKVLKTGCAYESRQLESLHALLNALAVLAPIAVDLLRVRSTARDKAERPAQEVATPVQIELLRRFSRRYPLASNPTARDIMLAIAGLGGHIKNNGEPGWQVLYRGYKELLAMEAGWHAAITSRCDQS